MNSPKKSILGYTWLGWLNKLLLQFFFIRLAYSVDSGKTSWTIMKWIVPLTGWGRVNYRYFRHKD